jgi:hypothetical protein
LRLASNTALQGFSGDFRAWVLFFGPKGGAVR